MRKLFFAGISLVFCSLPSSGTAQSSDVHNKPATLEEINRFPYSGKLDLSQNDPNPLGRNQKTTIHYRAIDATSVMLVVYTSEGNKALVFENLSPGIGSVSIEANQLVPGTYTYALIINGRRISRKKMILVP
jgi:hypothetical protein